ncbi:MAG: ATP-binding protein [Nitrospirae bacterium]|nr:ATP-binding protein [Nitrospirota bacterium]
MNDNYSNTEWIYRERWIGAQVKSAIKTFPVVIISGARQVGKSTFLQNEFADFKYLSLDDFSILQQAKKDPASLWIGSDKIIIDEAQKAPELFPAVKSAVDRTHRKMRFLISGSSNLLLMKNISETLAGRAVHFEMLPMSRREIEIGKGTPANFFKILKPDYMEKEQDISIINPVPLMLKGFMPPLINLDNRKDILLWWEGYVKTYLERDLRDLSQIESLIDFRRVMESLALRTGNVLNQTEVGRDTGVSQPTVHRYIKLLEVSNIIKKVPAYYQSRTKRITKSPKVFFIDTGLSTYLSGYHDESSLISARELGSFFETMIFLHLTILSELMIPKGKIFYWRSTTGKEVDFIIEHGKSLFAIEAKLTKTPAFNDIKNLLSFVEENPKTVRGILLHAGSSIKWLHSKILAAPWWWIGE